MAPPCLYPILHISVGSYGRFQSINRRGQLLMYYQVLSALLSIRQLTKLSVKRNLQILVGEGAIRFSYCKII